MTDGAARVVVEGAVEALRVVGPVRAEGREAGDVEPRQVVVAPEELDGLGVEAERGGVEGVRGGPALAELRVGEAEVADERRGEGPRVAERRAEVVARVDALRDGEVVDDAGPVVPVLEALVPVGVREDLVPAGEALVEPDDDRVVVVRPVLRRVVVVRLVRLPGLVRRRVVLHEREGDRVEPVRRDDVPVEGLAVRRPRQRVVDLDAEREELGEVALPHLLRRDGPRHGLVRWRPRASRTRP